MQQCFADMEEHLLLCITRQFQGFPKIAQQWHFATIKVQSSAVQETTILYKIKNATN